MTASRPLHVCLDARLHRGFTGGVESVILGLAHGLSQLTDGTERYTFVCYEGHDDWLAPYVGGPCRIHTVPAPEPAGTWRGTLARRAPQVHARLRRGRSRVLRAVGGRGVRVARSDGTIERLGAHVMHFTKQGAFLTDVPSIYHPHDLQHLHLPQFFTPDAIHEREVRYRAYCDASELVAVASEWIRRDVITHYGLPPEKVVVVPWAPPVDAYATPPEQEQARIRSRLGLPERFFLYPAATWEHKNHLLLVEALAQLRARRPEAALVCTGMLTDHYPLIAERVAALGLEDAVHFTGFVEEDVLAGLFSMARAVVVPTMFEALSFPIWEAFRSGTPVAASTVTSLPEQVGDAGLLFDPHDREALRAALQILWEDDERCATLAKRGRERVAELSWEATARAFRAHYRHLAGRPSGADELEHMEAILPDAGES